MKTRKAIIVCLCEVACCFIGGVAARVVITVIKNAIRGTDGDL